MRYLVLIFHAPLQSWGSTNLPDVNRESGRNTYLQPTFSGVIGLLRSSLGKERTDEEDDLGLKNIRLLTRTDRSGTVVRDYNVAEREHHGYRAGGTKEIPKYYLEDATFIVLVGHDNPNTITTLRKALNNPHWAPFLGRRAHVPSLPLCLGEVETTEPREFLQNLPVIWGASKITSKTILYTDSEPSDSDVELNTMVDYPLEFNPKKVKYASRTYVKFAQTVSRESSTSQELLTEVLELKERLTHAIN